MTRSRTRTSRPPISQRNTPADTTRATDVRRGRDQRGAPSDLDQHLPTPAHASTEGAAPSGEIHAFRGPPGAKIIDHQVQPCVHHREGDPVKGDKSENVWSGKDVRFHLFFEEGPVATWTGWACSQRNPTLDRVLATLPRRRR